MKQQEDWHRADIKAALEKAGWTLAQLSIANGMNRRNVQKAFYGPYSKVERIIAEAINVRLEEIWPSRYLKENKRSKNYRRAL